jgi:polyamine oxidase
MKALIDRRRFMVGAATTGFATLLGACGTGPQARRPDAAPGPRGAPLGLTVDDGSLRVPAAVPGEAIRVIVIGAGVAGLVAARALRRQGVEVVLVEARERVGGRIQTFERGGVPIDLGAAWVHRGPAGPTAPLFERLGVGLLPASVLGMYAEGVALDVGGGRYPDQALTDGLRGAFETFFAEAPALARKEVGARLTLADALSRILSAEDPVIRSTLGRFLSVFDGASPDELGLRPFVAAFAGDTGGEDHFPSKGYGVMVEALAEGLDVRLSTRVTGVRETGAGVEVVTADEVLAGSHALVTVPLGVLKAGAIAFDPPLDAVRRQAIERLGFGAFEKVALVYEERFWAPSPSGAIAFGDERPDQWTSLLDLGAWHGRPALVAVTTGHHARAIAGLAEEARIASVRALVDALAGGRAPEPIAAAATAWTSDPSSLGCYSHRGRLADGFERALATLAEPHGRVLFAGEATSVDAHALVDGAWLSGVREAKRLLRASRVEL